MCSFVMDETTKHNASPIIEMVALTLEDCKALSRPTGKQFPHTAIQMTDNTVREANTSFFLGYLNNLAAALAGDMLGPPCVRLPGGLRAGGCPSCLCGLCNLGRLLLRNLAGRDFVFFTTVTPEKVTLPTVPGATSNVSAQVLQLLLEFLLGW